MFRSENRRWFLYSALLLTVGLAVYAVFQPQTVFFARFIPSLAKRSPVAGLISSYGADLCWAMSFALGIQGCFNLRGRRRWWLLLCSLLGCFYEFGQYCGWFAGTFDPWDLAVYGLGTWIAILLTKQGGKK